MPLSATALHASKRLAAVDLHHITLQTSFQVFTITLRPSRHRARTPHGDQMAQHDVLLAALELFLLYARKPSA
eukprot:5373945-Pleurochrysis_carterae.AAC.1